MAEELPSTNHYDDPALVDLCRCEYHNQQRAALDQHRQADDNRDPYDAAEHDLIEFIRKHHFIIDSIECVITDRDVSFYGDGSPIIVTGDDIDRLVPVRAPGDGVQRG